jgi:hypothetical protein
MNRSLIRRRGSNTIEFALILPLFLALIAVTFEYGFYFFMRATVAQSVREGCRSGSVVAHDENPGPQETAEQGIARGMASTNFMGADCESVDDDRCTVSVSFSGSSPSELIVCTMEVAYGGITGAIPVPEQISYSSFSMMEVQQ